MTEYHLVTEWKLIGSRLGIPTGQLDIIENDNNNKIERCCFDMLMYWCDVNPSASLEMLKEEVTKIKSIAATINISVIEKVKSFLFHRYNKARYSKLIKLGLPYKPEQFTSVAYIHHKHSEVTEESVTAVAKVIHNGDIIIDSNNGANTCLQSVQPNDYYTSCTKGTNILEFLHTIDSIPKRKPFLVLIEGSPGIGKTSVCKEIAYQWSKDDKTDLTFFICLHETATQNIISFETLFEYICPGKQSTQLSNVSDYLATGADKRVLVIIDAYEELCNNAHHNSKTFINNIIKCDVLQFQNCDLVISTQCAGAVIDLSERKNWHRVELLGFTEEQQQQYLECNAERDVVKLTKYLNAKSVVKSLCFHPLFINMMVFLYNRLEHLPKFQTELIDKFTCIMILWVSQHQPDLNILDITLSVLLQNLPEKYQIALHKYCNLAFNALQEEVVIFGSKHDARAVVELKTYKTRFGFLKVFENKKSSFHLLIIQEFLAAFFVMQSGSNLKDLWVKSEWHHKYINVWAYYFGLRKVVPEKIKGLLLASSWFKQTERLSSKILQDKVSCLYLVYCLRELPDEGIYQQAKKVVLKTENILDISSCRELTNDSLSIVTSFLSYYIVRQWECFSLSNCSLDDDKLDKMLYLLMHRVKYMPKVDILDLSSNQLTMKSVTGIFKIACIMNTSKVLLSHNDKIKDEEICKNIVSYTEMSINDNGNLKVIENVKTFFWFSKVDVNDLHSLTTLTNLYIIRCPLDGEVLASLVTVLKIHETLSLLYLYDNNISYNDLFEVLKKVKHLTSVMVFEKSISDIHMDKISSTILTDFALIQVLLVSASKLLAQAAADYQILTALEYNPLIVHLQLNDCHITDEVMSKIAIILNSSSQQWSLLDLSGSKIGDGNLGVLCSALNTECKVPTLKLTGNQLTSLALIAKVTCCLNPKIVDISDNSVTVDDGRILEVTENLFTSQRELYLTLTCERDNIIICHSLDQASLAVTFTEQHGQCNFTQLLLVDCSVDETFLINALQKSESLKLLHLQNVKRNEEYINILDILKRHQLTLLISENELTDSIIENVMNFVDLNVKTSIVLSTDNVFLAHNCSYEILQWHLVQHASSVPLKSFYVCNCSLKDKPFENCLAENFLNKNKFISEIILCKNQLDKTQLKIIFDIINQLHATKVFISEDSLNCNDAVNKLSCSSLMLVGSKIVIGKGATKEQVVRAAGLISQSTLVVRMIKCNVTSKGFELLVSNLKECDKIQEFTFCSSNFNNTWGYEILIALQNTVTIKKLYLTSSNITAGGADALAAPLAAVISNNKTLERLSIAFNILPVTASSKILKDLSEITSLKQLIYYNNENCADELTSAINSNSGLEELRLNNYKCLQTDEIMEISVILNKLSKLKVLSLTNHKILEPSAINLAVAINDKPLHILHLGSNNLQSEGINAMAEKFKNISTLKNIVLNDNGITEEASVSLATLINANKNLEMLYLNNNILKTTGMNKLSAVIQQLTTLKVLNLKCNKLDSEAADGIATAITNNQSLEVINLGDNNLRTVGVVKVAEALSSIHCLKCLDLSKNNVSKEAADNISSVIACNTGLEKLLLHDNILESNGIVIICAGIVKCISNLRVLRISSNYIQTEAADDIAEVIIHNPLLEVFDVGNNRLLSEGVIKIAKALRKIHHIKELCLNANYITEEAADNIATVIASNTNLQRFSLDKNHLNSPGISKVCGTLKEISTLRVFLIDNNAIDKHAADDIAEVIINNPLLEYVGLGSNKLQAEGVIIVANALKQIHNVTVLSLDNNQITEKAAEDIALAISSNTGLEKLWLNNNVLGTNGIQVIYQSLKQISTLKLLQIDNNGVNKKVTKEIIEIINHNPLLETICIGRLNLQFDDELLANLLTNYILAKYFKTLNVRVTDDAADDFASVILSNAKLEKLILKGTPFLDKGITTIANALKEKTTLKVLHFSGCEIIENAADDVAAAIINNPLLENFHLGYCKWNLQGFVKIYCSLKKSQLKELSLYGICLTDSGVDKIQDLVANNKGLEKLRLSNNNLTDAGIAKLSVAFKETTSVKVLNLASNGITEQAADDITTIIINSPIMESIDLSNNKLKSGGIRKLACALKRLSHLKTIALNGNQITEAAANDIAEVITNNNGLEELWLNKNQLMSAGIKIICGSLWQISYLQLLQLENNQITNEAADEIASVINSNPAIGSLCLGENKLKTEGVVKIMSAVKNVHQLKMLTLHGNQVTDDAAIAIATAIVSNTALEKLWLFNNQLADKGITTIIKALKNIHTLKNLSLHSVDSSTEYPADDIAEVINNNPLLEGVFVGNFISQGVRKVTNALKSLSNLTILGFNNKITEDIADDIAEVISNNSELEYLWITNNDQEQWILTLLKILQRISTLKRLNLSSNCITDETADDLARVITSNRELEMLWLGNNKLRSAGINKITNALQHLTTLSHLELNNNDITEEAADGIAAVIINKSSLHTVSLQNNKLAPAGIIKIAHALKDINHLKLLKLNNNCVTDKAANTIADVIHSNTELMNLYLNDNNLQSNGIKVICNSLMLITNLTVLQLGNNSITDEAADGIAAVINNNPLLQIVTLGDKLKTQGVIKIANALKNIQHLKVLEFNNNFITDKAANAIADVIHNNTELIKLYLNDNNLQSNGIKIICKSLMYIRNLEVLQLGNNSITDEAAGDIAAVIYDNHKLEKLWLHNNKLSLVGINKITNALQYLNALKDLQLHDNKITEEAADDIAAVINNNPSLQVVTLGENRLGTEGVIKIANALKNIKHLKLLELNNNYISDKAANAIADVIHSNTELMKLYLNDNNLQSNGTKIICKSLMHIRTLEVLQLGNNSIIEDAIDDIANVITNNPLLEELYLNNNGLLSNGILRLSSSLMKIFCLKELNMHSNCITEDAAGDIAEVINSNHKLEKLWLHNNKLKSVGINKITKALQCLNSLRLLQLSNNEITEEAADGIAAVINNNPLLQAIGLGNNKLETEGLIKIANTLKNTRHLVVLELNDNGNTDKAANAIADVIHSNTKLMKLYLNGINLQPNGTKIICNSLIHINSLQVLQLGNNSITEEAADDIANVITNNPLLKELYLGSNKLLSKGILKLSRSLKQILHLQELNMDNNYITEEAADDIAEVINSNCMLEKLWLNNNKFSSVGINKITQELQHLKILKLLQLDNNLITEEAADGIAAVIHNNPLLHTVGLGNNKLGTEGVIKIANALKNIKHLKVLKLNNNGITDKAANAIADVIHSNTELEKLYLNDNNIRSNGTKVICESLKCITTLKVLFLQNNFITEEATSAIATVITNNPLLENFDVSNNKIKPEGTSEVINALKSLFHLKVLSFHHNQITDNAANDIAQLITNNCALEKVWLNHSKIKSANIRKIAQALQHLNTLKLLQLDSNDITEEAADGIAAVINNNPLLQTLTLGENRLETEGVITIADALKNINHLKVLGLNNNCITDKAANAIADVIHSNAELEELYLGNNSLRSNGTIILCRYLMQIKTLKVLLLDNNYITKEAAGDIARVIDCNPFLETLGLGDNKLLSTGISILCCSLKKNQHLKFLRIHGNFGTEEAAQEIIEVINNNCELEKILLGQNNFKFTSQNSKLDKPALFGRNKLQELTLNHCLLKSSEVSNMMCALKTHTTIRVLWLHCNYITNRHKVADNIAQLILNNCHIEGFYIGCNPLQARGITTVLESLKQLNLVKALSLGRNDITEDVSDDIVDVITNNIGLELLGLPYTCIYSDGAAKMIRALKYLSNLKLLEIAGNNINKEAADDLATTIINNSNLVKLYIADNCLETVGVTKIATALITPRGLEVLDLTNNNITGDAAESIAKVILANPSLQSLLLGEGCSQLRNAIRLKVEMSNTCNKISLDKLNDLFLAKQMQEIKEHTKIYGPSYFFSYCVIETTIYCNRICDISKCKFNSNTSLTSNYNNLQSDGIKTIFKAFASVTSLQVFSIENNDVDDEAADDIAAAIKSNNGIKQLWIGQNHFTPSGISTILQSFLNEPIISLLQLLIGATLEGPKPTLEVLDLSYSNLSQQTAVDISAVLSKNDTIKQLWLEGNNLSSQCITTIVNAIKKCTNISVFSLRDNNISDEVADVLSEALSKKLNLQQLYLGNNHLQDRGVIKITEALNTTEYLLTLDLMNNNISEAAADALASVITSCSQLKQLYLGDNKLQSTGTIKITRALQQAKCRSTLRVLDLSNNRIGSDETVGDEISRAVGNTEILTVLILDDNAISVDGVWRITRSLSQSAEYMMIFSVMHNDVMISEETKDDMRAVMAGQQPDCAMYL